jgi:hypothetical protein
VDLITVRRFERANDNPKSGQVTSVKTEDEHDSFWHVGWLVARGIGVSSLGEREFSESLDIRPHLNKLDTMLPVKEYHR